MSNHRYHYQLGIFCMGDEISKVKQNEIQKMADRFENEARKNFEKWLNENGYENAMGMIIEKK